MELDDIMEIDQTSKIAIEIIVEPINIVAIQYPCLAGARCFFA